MTYQKKIANTLDCGAVITIDVLKGKWKSKMLHNVAHSVHRPSALHRSIPGITRRVLNVQLAELERYGLLYKNIVVKLPLQVEYHLTGLGESILPVVTVMEQWGNAHRAELAAKANSEPSDVLYN
jgi:DNA-binding HxlR family transcriptional regulator